jgi:hypothetical protein
MPRNSTTPEAKHSELILLALPKSEPLFTPIILPLAAETLPIEVTLREGI